MEDEWLDKDFKFDRQVPLTFGRLVQTQILFFKLATSQSWCDLKSKLNFGKGKRNQNVGALVSRDRTISGSS